MTRKTSDFFVPGKYSEESFLVVDSISSNAVTIPEGMNLDLGGGGKQTEIRELAGIGQF